MPGIVRSMLAGALLLSPPVAGSPPAAPTPQTSVRYIVRPGDNWQRIGALLGDPRAVDALAERNDLRPRQPLVRGQAIFIPVAWLKAPTVQARILSFRGAVRIQGASQARIGGTVGEGARIVTGPAASITLRLPDGSIVTLPSQSAIRIERLRYVTLRGVYDRRFVLEKGRSQYEVTPDHRDGSRFDIRTPVSVAAVRGTIFRVSLPPAGGANTETLRGDVGVAGRTGAVDVAQGFGVHSDRNATGKPVKLLPPPRIRSIQPTALGAETVLLAPVAGARSYHVQLAKDKAFTQLLGETSGPQPSLALTPTEIGTYYLRVTAIDARGLEGLPEIVTYHHDTPERQELVPGTRPSG